MRELWQTEPERMLPGHDGTSNFVYTEDGSIHCYDKVSDPPVRHPMSYIGYEPERQTLKYRCPARYEGWECPMSTTWPKPNIRVTRGKVDRYAADTSIGSMGRRAFMSRRKIPYGLTW